MVKNEDHTPPAWVLDNPVRRLFSPPGRVIDLLDPRPGAHVLDLGAGVGYYADATLARLGPQGRLTLVDIHAGMLQRYLRRHAPDPRLRTLVSSAASLGEVPSASVDRVLSAMMLCDLKDKKGVLDEAWRVLRPTGLAYVSFHYSETPVEDKPFWVTPEIWGALSRAHPWKEEGRGEHRRARWYLLRRPEAPGDRSTTV